MSQGQISADGRWRWDGTRWVPVAEMLAPPPGYPTVMYAPAAPTNNMAIASLVFGILSWVMCPGVAAIVAVISGHMARRRIATTGEAGAGLAMAGLILGYLQLGSLVVVGLFWLLIIVAALVNSGSH